MRSEKVIGKGCGQWMRRCCSVIMYQDPNWVEIVQAGSYNHARFCTQGMNKPRKSFL